MNNVRHFTIWLPYDGTRWPEEQKKEFFPIEPGGRGIFTWTVQVPTQIQHLICDEMKSSDVSECFVHSVRVCMREQTIGIPMPLSMFNTQASDPPVVGIDKLQVGQSFQIEVHNQGEHMAQFHMRVEGIEGEI